MLWIIFVSFSDNKKIINSVESVSFGRNSSLLDSACLDSFIAVVMAQNHLPGISACIVKRGRIIWTGNSKTVTGAALMRLHQWGLFGLDDSINSYLPFEVSNPYYPDSVITFRMLLTHTSSIKDNWNFMPYFYHQGPPLPLEDYLENYFTPDSMFYSLQNFNSFWPGLQWQYCNIGYALIGYLVESISGMDFNQYCKDSIFARLGMSESSFFYSDIDTMHMAMPYTFIGNGNYLPYGHYSYYEYPAGSLKTSTIQLARFLIAFMQYGKYGNVRILDSATVRLILTPQFLAYPDQGLTWMKIYLGSRVFWGHMGGDKGIRTRMYYYPNDTTGALLFTNGDAGPGYDLILTEMFNYASNYVVSVNPISSNVPSDYILYQNYPNPFNPTTKIKFEIPSPEGWMRNADGVGLVTLKVYDILGKEVATLDSEKLQPGTYEVTFDGSNLPSGTYFYRLNVGEFTDTKRMILIK
ncbi:MAG: serine hydrolase [Ignavibacteria bacterium]|nr:serine hydrolase [Ignavibacteria bacterium]